MNYKVIFTPEAEQQLIELHAYISQEAGVMIANNYINGLLEYLEGFSSFPERGNKRDDIRHGLRVTNFKRRTIIAFAIDEQNVNIAGIYHGGQNYDVNFSTLP